jgi:hypothetical protein
MMEKYAGVNGNGGNKSGRAGRITPSFARFSL